MSHKSLPVAIFILLGISIFLGACTSSEPAQDILEPTLTPSIEAKEMASPSPAPATQVPTLELGDTPLTDEVATKLMYAFIQGSGQNQLEAFNTILEMGDTRFIPVLIELLRAYQIGLLDSPEYQTLIEGLGSLSGQSFGEDWPAWIAWYGGTDLAPPPGFTGWKGQLLGQIDPGFAGFLRDELPSTIRVEEIQWGGVQVDGIPALDNASMIAAEQADYLEPEEPVFGISINGDSRAYPLRILDWHEMANDVVGDVPVSLAYCTLCGAGIAYDGRAPNGETYTFGSSGFLFRSNKLMYDRQTRTLWNQLTGEPVLGELAGSGITLDLLPVVVSSWESWLEQHPDTLVLDIDTGYQRPYVPGAAYGDYFAYEDTMFPVWQRSEQLETKERIYALQIDGVPKAYPVNLLADEQVVNDTLGGRNLVLIATRGVITVEGINQRVGPVTYNAGGEVRAYDRQEEIFSLGPDENTVIDSAGRPWQVTEEALVGPDGELAARLNGHLAYWFGWYSFFPKTLVYGEQQ